jgi:hypothetical protein
MITDYGTDIWCQTDISPTIIGVGSDDIMPQVICHRLLCDPASLLSAPDEPTINLFSFLSQGIPRDNRGILAIKGSISAAVLADPRVYTAAIDLAWDEATETMRVTVAGTGAVGPFRLTLAVSAVSVQVLNQ